jgi:hypothetical protein
MSLSSRVSTEIAPDKSVAISKALKTTSELLDYHAFYIIHLSFN